MGKRRWWELVIALLKRAQINVDNLIEGDQNLQYLNYTHQNEQGDYSPQATLGIEANKINAVEGTTITYNIQRLRDEIFPSGRVLYEWNILTDPEVVKQKNIPARIQPPGNSVGYEKSSFEHQWKIPGNHKIVCRVKYPKSAPRYIEYQQTVLPSQEVINNALSDIQSLPNATGQFKFQKTYRDLLILAGQQDRSAPLEPEIKEQLDKSLKKYRKLLNLDEQGEVQDTNQRYPIKAVYLNSESAETIQLNLFLIKVHNSAFGGQVIWTLVDVTNTADSRLRGKSDGIGKTDLEAIDHAITSWEQSNRYYPGKIQLQIPREIAPHESNLIREVDTDGRSAWESFNDFLNAVSFATGILSLAAAVFPGTQPAAIPLFWISNITGTVGAASSIAQRRFEGTPNTTADVLDILGIVSNVLAGKWVMGATARLKGQVTSIDKGILIGQFVADGSTGIILNATYIERFNQIMQLKDPQKRTNLLIKLFQEATLNNGLLAISLKGNLDDWNTLRVQGSEVDIDFNNNPQEPTTSLVSPETVTNLQVGEGRINPEALSRFMQNLPEIKGVTPDNLGSFAAEILGENPNALVVRGVGELLSGGATGVSGAPVSIVMDRAGNQLAVIKVFPETEEFANELVALQRLGSEDLIDVGSTSVLGVGRTANNWGVMITSIAPGTAVDTLMVKLGKLPRGEERTTALAELRSAVSETAEALATLHTAPNGSGGTVSSAYMQRQNQSGKRDYE